MEIDNSVLYDEILEIADQKATDIHYRWTLEIIANDQSVECQKVLAVVTERDYLEDYSDVLQVDFNILLGDYLYDVLPYKDNLTAILSKVGVISNENDDDPEGGRDSKRYRITIAERDNPSVANPNDVTGSKESANRTDVIQLTAQLMSERIQDYRTRELSGGFRKATVEDVIKIALMQNVAQEGQSKLPVTAAEFLEGGFDQIAGVDMVPPTNARRYDHILIPPGIKLIDIPTYLQEQYGVYDTGIGYYLQDNVWYVYPIHDTTRYPTSLRTLSVANIPANRMAGADKTFLFKEGKLSLLSTGDVGFVDSSDHDQLNHGNGYRLVRSKLVVDNYSKTSGNITTFSRKENVSEVIVEEREDGKNIAFFANAKCSDNSYRVNSFLAARIGSSVSITWENSSPDLIKPGMPIKFLYVKDGETISLVGVVLATTSQSNITEGKITSNKYNTLTVIQAFLVRER